MGHDKFKTMKFDLDGAKDATNYMLKVYNSSKKDKEKTHKENKEKEKKVHSSYDWVNYGKDKDGNIRSYAKLKTEIEGGQYIVQVWDKKVYSDKGKEKEIQYRIQEGFSNEGYDKISTHEILWEINCKEPMTRLLRISDYDTNGETLRNFNLNVDNESKWDDVISGSQAEFLREKVCVTPKKPLKKK
jgi:hypothetical protein